MAAYQKFTDDAFSSARRQLDPVWDNRRDRFNQQMVSRGFAPGSKGFDNSQRNLSDAEDRSYQDAAFNSMQYGAGRKDTDRQLGMAERGQRISQNQFNRSLGENKRQFNEGTRRFDQGFGEQQRQFDEGTRRYDEGFGEDARRFNLGFGEQQRQFDMPFAEDQYRNRRDFGESNRRFDQQFGLTELSTLDNISRAYNDQAYRDAVFNASRDDTQMSQLMSMLGFAPTGGATPVDMGSAFNNGLYGQNMQQQFRSDRNQGLSDAFGGLFGEGGLFT